MLTVGRPTVGWENKVPITANLITDEAQGVSSFVNLLRFNGYITDVNVIRGQNAVSSGPNAGKYLAYFEIAVGDMRDAMREDDTVTAFTTTIVRVPYSTWDMLANRPTAPARRTPWFQVIVPHFRSIGVDLGDSAQVQALIGRRADFALREFALGYDRQKQTESRQPLFYDDDGEETVEVTGNKVMTPAMYQQLVPVAFDDGAASDEDPADVAADLWDEHTDGSGSTDVDAFRVAALANATIAGDAKLKRAIQTNKWKPAAA